MVDSTAALISIRPDDNNHNATISKMLGRARVDDDCGVNKNADISETEDAVIAAKPLVIKGELPIAIKTEPNCEFCFRRQYTSNHFSSNSHHLSSDLTVSSNDLPRGNQIFDAISTTSNDSPASLDAVALSDVMKHLPEDPLAHSGNQSENGDLVKISSSFDHSRVAVSIPLSRFCMSDLTDGREKSLSPLLHESSKEPKRIPTHQHENDKPLTGRANHTSATQSKQVHNNYLCSKVSNILQRMELLTPNEYDDQELYSDFQHMWQILIPANATAALLECRGQPIKTISKQAKCVLSIRQPVESPFKDDRVLRFNGKAKCICLAQRLVIASIREYRAKQEDPIYKNIADGISLVALPATSISKAFCVAISSGKNNNSEITSPFTWLVERKFVGKMMGRQGNILAAIRKESGATIYIDDDVVPGTTERRVTMIGSIDSIAAAINQIKRRSGGRPELSDSERMGQYFAIPSDATGHLIGLQGSTIKNISERTGARLQLPSTEDLPLGSVNRILHIQGTSKETEHAKEVVTARLREHIATSENLKTFAPEFTGEKGDKVTIKVILPSRICGLMLENHGKLIREISAKAGAHTHFLAPHNSRTRVCVFTGEMISVLRAQRLVLQIIAGDMISCKRLAKSRKRKRDQADTGGHMKDGELDESEDYDSDKEYCKVTKLSVRQHTVRRQELQRRPGYDDGIKDVYGPNDFLKPEYEMVVDQTNDRRPFVTHNCDHHYDKKSHESFRNEGNDHDDNDLGIPDAFRARILKQRAMMLRPRIEYQGAYEIETQECDDGNQRAMGNLSRNRSRSVVRPGRKVEVVTSSLEWRGKIKSRYRRRSTNILSYDRGKDTSVHQDVTRTKRYGRSHVNKRRRQ
ncbi:far upstream element-binding protein 3-like [Plasmopara halstedii]|uniref:Far upstream element-binding protein 3-like n=1 Tax=Plasmopara halstedii TaxID=4781 RepID=A0A0P1AH95_PLAHL|nr:far upstream element-binding protein 3-like [Plasmopara halstedii]CEG40482.1 far upstream element-binding protein 3-like [Plasmopara halstedii]|eukprot:XP_024576851.1 far upstream element-binding protein 3-like [Plasmopara halstedii]